MYGISSASLASPASRSRAERRQHVAAVQRHDEALSGDRHAPETVLALEDLDGVRGQFPYKNPDGVC